MRVIINGVETHIDGMTVRDVLDAMAVVQPYVAVALNGTVVRKSEFESTQIHDADQLEILVPMQGG